MWGKTDYFSEQYLCVIELFILSCLDDSSSVIVDLDIYIPDHGVNVVDGINTVNKGFFNWYGK